MPILALTPVSLVDVHGVKARLDCERSQGIPVDYLYEMDRYPEEYEDLGFVTYEGVNYFASIYRTKPIMDEDFLEISG